MGHRGIRRAWGVALLCAATLTEALGAVALAAMPPAPPRPPGVYARDRVVVRYRPGTSGARRAALRAAAGAAAARRLPLRDTEVVRLKTGVRVEDALDTLAARRDVLYAEPDYRWGPRATVPNDPEQDKLWGMNNTGQTGGTPDADVDAPVAWDTTTGSSSVVVAVVDTGVDYTHDDLQPNIWRNDGEYGGGKQSNGVDDDGNGLVDDWRGWDWVHDDNTPMDLHGHGTHVAGTVGARGNDGYGVAGMAWSASLMPLRVLDHNGAGWTSDIAAAFAYAGQMGAHVVNASLTGGDYSQAVADAVDDYPGSLFVVAAGNEGLNLNSSSNSSYPCELTSANLICVAATDDDDARASFSNYGSVSVDLAAPGASIYSTKPGDTFGSMSGTSMATPHVAGAAALLLSSAPGTTVAALRSALLDDGDALASLATITATGRRLNAAASLGSLAGIVVTQTAGATRVTEAGATDTYEVSLRTEPAANVTVTVTAGSGATVSPATLTFTSSDYGFGQTVTVTPDVADDATYQGVRAVTLAHATTSGDTDYDGLSLDVQAAVTDYEDVDPAAATNFVDDDGTIFEEHNEWLSAAGITLGCGDGKYCPRNHVTRKQMAAFLERGLGLPAATENYFTDDDGLPSYESSINALRRAEVTLGCNAAGTRFCPNNKVTRAQMAAFLVRALALPAASQDYFTDDDGTVFEDGNNRLREAGITLGCNAENTLFCPEKNVTREQMSAFIRRSLTGA